VFPIDTALRCLWSSHRTVYTHALCIYMYTEGASMRLASGLSVLHETGSLKSPQLSPFLARTRTWCTELGCKFFLRTWHAIHRVFQDVGERGVCVCAHTHKQLATAKSPRAWRLWCQVSGITRTDTMVDESLSDKVANSASGLSPVLS